MIVLQFYDLTIKLIQLLEKYPGKRDDKIAQIEMILSQREELMKVMVPPFTHEEVEVGKNIIQLNSRLTQLLQSEKTTIQKELKDLKKKKETSIKYVNPYQNLLTDGMFYDKRK